MTPGPDSPYLVDASGYRGSVERIFVPEVEGEIAQILRGARREKKPVTLSGARTGLTGSAVPDGGWLISLERFRRLEIQRGYAICGAGVLLRDVQAAAAASGQFYPPDPTENSSSIGGNIATNASGSRSFRYGPTRRYVRALRVMLASGKVLELRRGEKPPFELPVLDAPGTTKNTAGYYLRRDMDYLDLFIGSEGTLGITMQAELALIPMPDSPITGVVFFGSDERALDAVHRWRSIPRLRMLEYVDAASLDLVRPRIPEIAANARAALLIEEEDGSPDTWLDRLESAGALTGSSWFATSAADRERFRRFRHTLPEAVHDLVRRRGLTKMGSDFAVPIARNREMLRIYREALDREFPGQYVIYGHIGDAHLHVNILPASEREWNRAKQIMTEFARQAVALGGTVSAEHGLGKRKRDLLSIQYPASEIEKMKRVKRLLDQEWMLGPGTVFEPEE